jgi:hypothetical protein
LKSGALVVAQVLVEEGMWVIIEGAVQVVEVVRTAINCLKPQI